VDKGEGIPYFPARMANLMNSAKQSRKSDLSGALHQATYQHAKVHLTGLKPGTSISTIGFYL
jgi:hypothetical protein